MEKVQPEEYSHIKLPPGLQQVWKDDKFLCQIFEKENGITRLSINRVKTEQSGEWEENITWEELQEIKRKVGYGNFDAVEIFPRERDVVNVANMRHLWIFDKPLTFAWRKSIRQ